MLIEIFAEIIFLLRSCVKGICGSGEKYGILPLKRKRNPHRIGFSAGQRETSYIKNAAFDAADMCFANFSDFT